MKLILILAFFYYFHQDIFEILLAEIDGVYIEDRREEQITRKLIEIEGEPQRKFDIGNTHPTPIEKGAAPFAVSQNIRYLKPHVVGMCMDWVLI